MGIFKQILKRNRIPVELKDLNDACNFQFNKIFERCRRQSGRELVEVMSFKSSILDAIEKSGMDGARGKIAEKFLKLLAVYLTLIDEYSDRSRCINDTDMAGGGAEGDPSDCGADPFNTRLEKAYDFLAALHRQFFLLTAKNISTELFDDALKEAEALLNAVDIHYGNKRE
jgi:hypothetical protein